MIVFIIKNNNCEKRISFRPNFWDYEKTFFVKHTNLGYILIFETLWLDLVLAKPTFYVEQLRSS